MLKYTNSLNSHRIKDYLINEYKVDRLYYKYSQVEIQDYIIQYNYVESNKEGFFINLENKLFKVAINVEKL